MLYNIFMDETKQTTKRKSLSSSIREKATVGNAILLIVLLIAGGFVIGSVQAMQKNYDLQAQADAGDLDNEMQAIGNENLKLQQAYFQTNEYLELMARDKMNKAYNGENLVHLPPVERVATIDTGDVVAIDETSNFEKWVSFLFGRHE